MSEDSSVYSRHLRAAGQLALNWIASTFVASKKFLSWKGVSAALKACVIAASTFGWAIIGIAAVVVIIQSITAHVVNIEPISVPKTFADNGYSPDVASQRLRDALVRFAKRTGSTMQGPNLALTSELPKITVPKVEISVETAITLVHSILHLGNTRDISGEFVQEGKAVWLRLRINGQEIFTGETGLELTKLDDLWDAAAPHVIEEIQPYLAASARYKDDPDRALQMAEGITIRLPASDINVQWAFVLEGKYYLEHGKPIIAETYLRKAISLNSKNAAAHYSLGVALENETKFIDAIAEYRRAIEIEPSAVFAHNNLAQVLIKQGGIGDIDEAITQYRLAVVWDPLYVAAHNNLGVALKEKGNLEAAETEYRRAIEIDPAYARAHFNLAVLFAGQRRNEEAIAEFHRAIENNSNPNDPTIETAARRAIEMLGR